MTTRSILVVICSFLFISPTYGQNSAETQATLRGLPGVSFFVEPLDSSLEEKGMTHEVLSAHLERELRQGGVPIFYPVSVDEIPGNPTLYLAVTAVVNDQADQCACSIRLELMQTVHLGRDPEVEIYNAPTWSVGGVGMYYKNWRQDMIDDVAGYARRFVEAYFIANPPVEQ